MVNPTECMFTHLNDNLTMTCVFMLYCLVLVFSSPESSFEMSPYLPRLLSLLNGVDHQCRLNHRPNRPLARAPELQGPRAAGSGNFFSVEFYRQNIDWLSGFNLALKFIPKVCPLNIQSLPSFQH